MNYLITNNIIFIMNLQVTANTQVYDYIILGAGISGVQSLQILSRKASSILVIESQNYQGGRVLSETVATLPQAEKSNWIRNNYQKLNNVFIQKGATWIQQQHVYMLELCRKFGLELRKQNTNGDNLYLFNDKSFSTTELLNDKRFGPPLKEFVGKIDHLSKIYDREVLTFDKGRNRSNRILAQYDSKLVSEYLQENISTQQARDFIQNFLQHTQCVSCEQNSMHEVLTKNARSNDVGILKQFLGQYGHQPSYILNDGTSKLIQKFLKKIEKQLRLPQQKFINYNQQVITIDNFRADFCVIVTINNKTGKSRTYKCKKIICTIPLAVCRFLSFTNISKAKRFIFDNQLRTSCVKSFLIVKQPFWRSRASGDGLFSGQYYVNMCHDISPSDLSCGIIVFFHSGKKFRQWESKFKDSQDQFLAKKKYIIDLACKIFKVTKQQKAEYLEDALVYISTFMDNPHIRSGFQSCTSPGTFSTLIRFGQDLQSFYRDENNVYFIGSQYSRDFASYMQGAIRIARQKCFQLIGQKDDLFQNKEIRPRL